MPQTPPYVGSYRTAKPPSCRLAYSDLKRLFKLLQDKAGEATEKAIANLPHDQPEGDREVAVGALEDLLRVHTTIEGTSGQQIAWVTDPDALDEDKIGFPLRRVTLDSAAAFRAQTSRNPDNWVAVRLDFDTPPLLDFSNPSDAPTPNESLITVAGSDTTWVTAVFVNVQEFFDQRRLRRGWIHARHAYDWLVLLLGIPMALWLIHRVSVDYGTALAGLDQVLRVAVYVYLFIVGLILFRLGFSAVRWVFPLVELAGSQRKGARVAVTGFVGLVVLKLVVDLVKWLIQAAAAGIVGTGKTP